MSKYVISAVATARGRSSFCRCGRAWPVAGTLVSRGEFTDTEWARLEGEPHLHIRAAREDEEEAKTVKPDPLTEADQQTLDRQVEEAILALTPDGWDQQGKPKVGALKAYAPVIRDRLDAELRDRVFAQMVADGLITPPNGGAAPVSNAPASDAPEGQGGPQSEGSAET